MKIESLPEEVRALIAWALFSDKTRRDGFTVRESAESHKGWYAEEIGDPENHVTVWREGSRLRAL